jgi:hypothetical protein
MVGVENKKSSLSLRLFVTPSLTAMALIHAVVARDATILAEHGSRPSHESGGSFSSGEP